jgi:hypothetical protein
MITIILYTIFTALIAWASYGCGFAQGRIEEAENRFKKAEGAQDLRQLNEPY